MDAVRVTIWNEHVQERTDAPAAAIYPDGIHGAIAAGITPLGDLTIRTATLADAEHGLTDDVLAATDTLVWWGHVAHDQVADAVVDRVQQAVLGGMGLVVLHSGHESRIFRRLMGTTCSLRWREAGEHERLHNLRPEHPVLAGVGATIELPQEEMYGEPFDIPEPDELLMIGWFPGGEVFRSLCTWTRGLGRIVYLQPGHETHPTFHHPDILRVIANACAWARPQVRGEARRSANSPPLEPMADAR
ncbi:MAG: ThuA domain-containing protein [Candidatus Limnocylindrales bacterium]